MRNAFENLGTESTLQQVEINTEGLTLLRRIFLLLKPLGVISGSQSNRLSVDVNNVSGGTMIATQATAANLNCNVGTVSNQSQMGGVTAFDLMKAISRTGYNTGVRSNIS
jgi:hypothetical protein